MSTSIVKCRTQAQITPLGVDCETPMFSWQMAASRTGAKQSAYRIIEPAGTSAADGVDLMIGHEELGRELLGRAEGQLLHDAGRLLPAAGQCV